MNKDTKEKKIKKEEPNELQTRLDECQKKCDEYLNNWKRERADFINYKKDEIERIGFLGKCVKEDMVFKILPILDNFYLAESHMPEEFKEESPTSPADSSGQTFQAWKVWAEGFTQIQNQLLDFLKKEGIEEIKTIGEKFDPNTMEATEELEDEEKEHGAVIEEVQKGYTMDGKVIRPARVKISK